jgi:Holliday junction resolvasome RuvABC endonuclease subunit
MIILALDQSTRISGWSVFENKELKDFGHWTETSDSIGKRILNISNHIKDLINKYDPDLVVFENIQLQNRNIGVDTF